VARNLRKVRKHQKKRRKKMLLKKMKMFNFVMMMTMMKIASQRKRIRNLEMMIKNQKNRT